MVFRASSVAPWSGAHHVSGTKFLETFHDDAVTRLHIIENEPAMEADLSNAGAVVFADTSLPPFSLWRTACCGTASASGSTPLLDLIANIHSGQQQQLGIGKLAAQRYLPSPRIDRCIGEQQSSFMGIDLAIIQDEAHLGRSAVFKRSRLELASELAQLGGRLGEICIDGIELLDGCDMRRFGLTNQRTLGTRARPIRPLIGARIRVYSRLSLPRAASALRAATSASA